MAISLTGTPDARHYKAADSFDAAAYLDVWRKRLESGIYDDEHFTILAAKTYREAKLPHRALALLRAYVKQNPQDAAQFASLIAEATRDAQAAPCICTLTMIVKNEEKNIAQALASVDDVVDEIVICDTGSTDATWEIAQRFGATVLNVPWENDFSKARNIAIDASCGSWILWMDGDDRLDAASKQQLKNICALNKPHTAGFRIVNMRDNVYGAEFMQVRLFPRCQEIRFERRVHEQIMPSAHRAGLAYQSYPFITIIHTGYNDQNAIRAKAERNKPLIIEELLDNPDSPILLHSLGDCLMMLEEHSAALAAYQKIIAQPALRYQYTDVYVQAYFNTGLIHRAQGNTELAQLWFRKTAELDPTRSEALYLLGIIAEEEGQRQKAFSYFLDAGRIKPPVRQTATDALRVRIDSVFRVSKHLFDKGDFKSCAAVLMSSVETYPAVVDYHTLLGKALLCQDKLPHAAKAFMASLSLSPKDNPDSYRGMAVIYLLMGDRKRAGEFLAKINPVPPLKKAATYNPVRVAKQEKSTTPANIVITR